MTKNRILYSCVVYISNVAFFSKANFPPYTMKSTLSTLTLPNLDSKCFLTLFICELHITLWTSQGKILPFLVVIHLHKSWSHFSKMFSLLQILSTSQYVYTFWGTQLLGTLIILDMTPKQGPSLSVHAVSVFLVQVSNNLSLSDISISR